MFSLTAVLQNKAAHARWEGRTARKQMAEKQARDMASYRTRVGAGGVTFEGTPTEVIFDREKENLYEQKLLAHDYEMKAYDFLTSAAETSYSGAMKSYLTGLEATEMAFSGANRIYGMMEKKLTDALGGGIGGGGGQSRTDNLFSHRCASVSIRGKLLLFFFSSKEKP